MARKEDLSSATSAEQLENIEVAYDELASGVLLMQLVLRPGRRYALQRSQSRACAGAVWPAHTSKLADALQLMARCIAGNNGA